MTALTDRLVAESSLEFCRRAPMLARAHAHMQEMERVLGWIRGRWTGGVDVLVAVDNYLGHQDPQENLRWAKVIRVSVGGSYPVKAEFLREPGNPSSSQEGQWAFHEVIDLRFWDLSEMRNPIGINYPGHPQWDPFPEPITSLSQLSAIHVPERTP